MHVDGECHCGHVTFEAEIDPQAVSICHCTDCQSLTGSPFRVTVICSGEQIRIQSGSPKIYAKTVCWLRLAVHQRRRRADRRLGHPVGQHTPTRPVEACSADLVPVGGTVDQGCARIACPSYGL